MSNSPLRDKSKEFAKQIVPKFEIAQKECYETAYWLEPLFDTGYIPESQYR